MCSGSDVSFGNYPMWDGCLEEIDDVVKKYPELKAEMGNYFPNNCPTITLQRLVSLTGTVPVSNEENNTCNIPVVIWIPTKFPREMPEVFLVPTRHVIPNETLDDDENKPFVGPNGRVNLRTLKKDYNLDFCVGGDSNCCDLETTVDSLVEALSKWPPRRYVTPGHFQFPVEVLPTSTFSTSLTVPLKLKKSIEDITKQLENTGVFYRNQTETVNDLLSATSVLRNPTPVLLQYLQNNGTGARITLLALSGTLVIRKIQEIKIGAKPTAPNKKKAGPELPPLDNRPAINKVLRFEIPLLMWFPNEYPESPPFIFVKRSKTASKTANLEYLNQYGEVDLANEFEWEDLTLLELLDGLTTKLLENPPLRHVSWEIKSTSDEEIETDESSDEEEPQPETKMIPMDAALRLFLSTEKNNECQEVKQKVRELLKAKQERNKVHEAILSEELFRLLGDPNFLKDWEPEHDDESVQV